MGSRPPSAAPAPPPPLPFVASFDVEQPPPKQLPESKSQHTAVKAFALEEEVSQLPWHQCESCLVHAVSAAMSGGEP